MTPRDQPCALLILSIPRAMLTHRGFEAWIECDDETLTSYNAWCDGRIIGATVASKAGKVLLIVFERARHIVLTLRSHRRLVCIGGISMAALRASGLCK